MAFSNVWDDTIPADTQLANLLGSDLRNFRLDVQQRMGAISGLDAAKPNFAGDAQPTNWTGVLFFATDTGKIYQFSGASWSDVTSDFLSFTAYKKYFVTGGTTNGNGQTLFTLTIPSGVMKSLSQLELDLGMANTVSSSSTGFTVNINGTPIPNLGPSNGVNIHILFVFTSTTTCVAVVLNTTAGGPGSPQVTPSTLTVADVTANAFTITVVQNGPNGLTGYIANAIVFP